MSIKKVSPEKIRILARLVHLQISEDDILELQEDLGQILTYIDRLDELDIDRVSETNSLLSKESAQDNIQPSLEVETLLNQAPDRAAGYFRVPKIIDNPDY